MTEQREAIFSNCGHGNGGGVDRHVVLMKQRAITQLFAPFLLDSRPKFLDQFSVVDTSNSLPSLQVVNHQHTLTIPEYRCQDFVSRGNLAKLNWHRQNDMLSLLALLLGLVIEMMSTSLIHGNISAEKLCRIYVVLAEIVT